MRSMVSRRALTARTARPYKAVLKSGQARAAQARAGSASARTPPAAQRAAAASRARAQQRYRNVANQRAQKMMQDRLRRTRQEAQRRVRAAAIRMMRTRQAIAARSLLRRNQLAKSRICSFHADTLVAVEGGNKRIADIAVGLDRVLARHPETGERAFKPVRALFESDYETAVHIHVQTQTVGQGPPGRPHEASEALIASPLHPFYVDGAGWVKAGALHAGQRIATDTDAWATVQSVDRRNQQLHAYNLEVADFHTFFVQAPTDSTVALWVHNECEVPPALKNSLVGSFRHAKMRDDNVGYNVSAKSDDKYPMLGKGGRTFVTDRKAINHLMKMRQPGTNKIKISRGEAEALAGRLGLKNIGQLNNGFKVREIKDLNKRDFRSVKKGEGNPKQRGENKHLSEGDPEATVKGVSPKDGGGVTTVLEVEIY